VVRWVANKSRCDSVSVCVCDKAERNERGECLGLTAIVLKRAPNVSACVCLCGWWCGGVAMGI